MMPAAQLAPRLESAPWQDAIDEACERIVPTWPLDQAIAVNPWWGWRDTAFADVAAKLQARGKIHCLMPPAWYLERWKKPVQEAHLMQAAAELGVDASTRDLLTGLEDYSEHDNHWGSVADMLDAQPDRLHRFAWHEEITQQISQFCGLYFSYPERMQTGGSEGGLFQSWLRVVRHDRGIEVLMAEPGMKRHFQELPEDPDAVFEAMYRLTRENTEFAAYAHALLLDINGWASWLAWGGWQKSFRNQTDDGVRQLLAIRMAWDYILCKQIQETRPELFETVLHSFTGQFEQQGTRARVHLQRQRILWVWQRAVELAYQSGLQKTLTAPASPATGAPALQAVFCIDVRSEPMRRALEAQHPGIRTLGFAGFFGLPLQYTEANSQFSRPQLPGLIAPSIEVTQRHCKADKQPRSQRALQIANNSAPAAFGLVEGLGLGKIAALVKQSWFAGKAPHAVNDCIDDSAWELHRDGEALGNAEKAELVAGVLRGMGLTANFAPTVLFLGHACSTANNPQRAALDCGACGGQSGEINARVLAQLLNEPGVRLALQSQGITIPQETVFYGGLHDTTTDAISCPGAPAEAAWKDWLTAAEDQARANRAASLGLDTEKPQDLHKLYQERGQNWAQLRPEWGLANNAAFVVASRDATRGKNLDGRCFLHDYRWQDDTDFKVLETIMTAPMIVTNWINLQYYASVTDHQTYGSGNKLLHNVVGGNIGVFEGNGGDLRIGLSRQSIHDGKDWRHEPLRLSVYIDAPKEAIEAIVQRHEDVAHLVNNDWLYLFQWDTNLGEMARYYKGQWRPVAE